MPPHGGVSARSMSVDTQTVLKIARLARIAISEDEARALEPELNNILGFVEQLGEVDTDDVKPMTSVVPMTLRRRADEVTDGGIREDVLANAPDRRVDFFAVPKVVE